LIGIWGWDLGARVPLTRPDIYLQEGQTRKDKENGQTNR